MEKLEVKGIEEGHLEKCKNEINSLRPFLYPMECNRFIHLFVVYKKWRIKRSKGTLLRHQHTGAVPRLWLIAVDRDILVDLRTVIMECALYPV